MNANGTTGLLQQANYILDACGRQQSPSNVSWVDIPAHVGYSRYLAYNSVGSEDITGVQHKGRVSFMIRAITAQILPRVGPGVYWRLKLPNGKYHQSALTAHGSSFGFGSDRMAFAPAVEWRPGEKMFVDLDTILGGPPPAGGYAVVFQFEGAYRFPLSGPGSVRNPLDVPKPRYFLNENQNILAPEFRFGPGCPSETPAGFWDEEWCYVSQLATLPTNGAPVSNVQCQIDTDSDFLVRQVWPYIPGVPSGIDPSGNVVFRLRRGDGYAMSSNFIPVNSVRGALFKELKVKQSDSLYFDAYLTDLTGSGAGVSIPSFTAPVLQSTGFVAFPVIAYPDGRSGATSVFTYGGNLYQVLQSFSNGEINVFKSSNGGTSWAPVAVGTGPTGLAAIQQGGVYFDGNQTVTVAFCTGDQTAPASAPIVLQDFDLATGTWGATYGAGSGNVYQVNALFVRSDGSMVCICINGVSPLTTAAYIRTSGGVWSHVSLDSLLSGGWTSIGNTCACYDPSTGTIHMFSSASGTKQYYQQFLLNNTVANFQDTTAVVGGPIGQQISASPPIILQGQLLWGVCDPTGSYATILVGAPLSNPVFSVGPVPGVNPIQPNPAVINQNTLAPQLATDGTTLWAAFIGTANAPSCVYVSFTNNLSDPTSGWLGGQVILTGGLTIGQEFPTLAVINGSPNITLMNSSTLQNYFLKGLAPASIQFGLYFYGVKRKPVIA